MKLPRTWRMRRFLTQKGLAERVGVPNGLVGETQAGFFGFPPMEATIT